jgi:UrcA family protein
LRPSINNFALKEIAMNNTNIRAIRAITISTAIVLGFSAAIASANTANSQSVNDGVKQYTVRFADLDLSKLDGAAVLYRRLNQAAAIVCSPLQSRRLGMAAQYQLCVNHAIAGAVSSVDRPMLSQYHESQTKGWKAAVAQLARVN